MKSLLSKVHSSDVFVEPFPHIIVKDPIDPELFIDDKQIQVVKTVKYQSNVLVLFLNSIKSLHGVTVRSVANEPRLFLNLIGEVNRPLFNLEDYQTPETYLKRLLSKFSKRK